MKKLFALALTLVLLFVMAAPAMAAGGEDAVSPDAVSCNGNHVLYPKSSTTTYTKTQNGHIPTTTTVMGCRYCTYTETSSYEGGYESHNPTIYKATCNGTMQTWYRGCSVCGYHISTTNNHRCPGAVHTGDCLWLPV